MTCDVGELVSGASAIVIIEVTVDSSPSGILTNTASVKGNEIDPDPENDTAAEVTSVQVGELKYVVIISTGDADTTGVILIDSPDPVFVGNSLTYDLTIINNGSTENKGVTLEVTLPSSVTFESVTVALLRTGILTAAARHSAYE